MRHLFHRNAGSENHVSDDLLLKQADGELSQREADQVIAHLKCCWNCRGRSAGIEQAITDFVQYQTLQLRPFLPPTPAGRSLFLARLDQMADRRASRPMWHRAFFAMIAVRNRRITPGWVGVVAAACLMSAMIFLLTRPPGICAAEILQRAHAAEVGSLSGVVQPVVFQKLLIRADGYSFTRTIYRDTLSPRRKDELVVNPANTAAGIPAGESATAAVEASDRRSVGDTLEQEFVAAKLNWQDPLSVWAHQSWREALKQREEAVTRSGDELVLSTSTPEGPVAGATLRVRVSDYHILAKSIRLRSGRRIEITEIGFRVIPGMVAAGIFSAEPRPVRAPTPPEPRPVKVPTTTVAGVGFAASHPPAPTPHELAETEVQTLVALHVLGADLGEPIEIVSRPAGLEVSGLADSLERKEELRAALSGIPHLAFRIQTIAEAIEPTVASGEAVKIVDALHLAKAIGQKRESSATVVAEKPPLQNHMMDYFASQRSKEAPAADSDQANVGNSIQQQVRELSRHAIRLSEEALSRAWALRRLAKRYTREEIANLSPKARRDLESIIRDQVRALAERLNRSRTLLVPLLESVPRVPAHGSGPRLFLNLGRAEWPNLLLNLFDLVNYIDRVTSGLLAGSDFPREIEELPEGDNPLRIKSPEENAADLLFLLQGLKEQLPQLESIIAGLFLE